MAPVSGAELLCGHDITHALTKKKIIEMLGGAEVDAVLSDMAPNATGIKTMDHELIIHLSLAALKFSTMVLKEEGSFLCKIWQGGDQKLLESLMKRYFECVHLVKPDASRGDSAEIYLHGKNFCFPG